MHAFSSTLLTMIFAALSCAVNADAPSQPNVVVKADATAEDQEQLRTRYTECAVDFIKHSHDT